jgi:hypothetical protein
MTIETDRRSVEPLVEASAKPVFKRWWFVPALAATALLGMLALTVIAFVLYLYQQSEAARAQVAAEVAKIQARGEPITTEDFYRWHRVPPGTRDITQIWLNVLASFDENQVGKDGAGLPMVGNDNDLTRLRADVPGSQLDAAEQFLAKYAATLDAAKAAAKEPGECRYPIRFELGINAQVAHAQKMRTVLRMLLLDVRVKAARGDYDGAIESLDAMYAAGQSLEHQSTLVEQLVASACIFMAMSETEFLLNETQLSGEQLSRLEVRLKSLDPQQGLTTGMIGERGLGYHSFHHMSLSSPDQVAEMSTEEGRLSRPEDCQKYLTLMDEMIGATREKSFLAIRQRAEQAQSEVMVLAGSRNPLERAKFVMTALVLPATGAAVDVAGRLLAKRDLLLVAIAAEKHRQQNGSLPAALADLSPEFLPTVLTDPFDGRPLRMIAGEGQLVLYSIGKDGKDDRGLETGDSDEPDITVRLQAVKGAQP